jgi:hypothetical protein
LGSINLQDLVGRPPSELSDAELQAVIAAEKKGGIFPGELPFHIELDRNKALDSPAYLATEIIDPYYKDNFEPIHYAAMDDVLGPYMVGETVRIEGANYDPKQYLGLLVLFSRDTFKSSMLWMMFLWLFCYTKIRQNRDTRAMYVHQVLKKAIKRGENIRDVARHNKKFRSLFPEFRAPSGEWDTKEEWSWRNYAARAAGESSFTAYGETSDKTGGHYTIWGIDDWVTQESVGTADQIEKSWDAYRAMDPLRDRSLKYHPRVIAGTNYHFQDTYKRMEKAGGYLVWRAPAHSGSPKKIFDICSVDVGTKEGMRRAEVKIRALERDPKIRALERDPPGKLYFPNRLDWRELYRCARAQGPHIYNCNPGYAPILMSDWTIKPLQDVIVGDEVVGFGSGGLVRSEVLSTNLREAQTVKVRFDNGAEIVCTPDHEWYTGRNDDSHSPYLPVVPGRSFVRVIDLPQKQEDLAVEWAYFAGMVDGEGAVRQGQVQIHQSQKHNADVCYRIASCLDALGLEYSHNTYDNGQVDCWNMAAGRSDVVQMLHNARFGKRHLMAQAKWEHAHGVGRKTKVVAVEVGDMEHVYALRTSTGNYVCWGIASRNCQMLLNPVPEGEQRFDAEALDD